MCIRIQKGFMFFGGLRIFLVVVFVWFGGLMLLWALLCFVLFCFPQQRGRGNVFGQYAKRDEEAIFRRVLFCLKTRLASKVMSH